MLHASPHLVKQPRPIYKYKIFTVFLAEGAQFTLSSFIQMSVMKQYGVWIISVDSYILTIWCMDHSSSLIKSDSDSESLPTV